jgi:hypothetical protein
MPSRKTVRGFRIYAQFYDQIGTRVRVQESSLATDACVWIFTDKDQTPHLTRAQARKLIRGLEAFLKHRGRG